MKQQTESFFYPRRMTVLWVVIVAALYFVCVRSWALETHNFHLERTQNIEVILQYESTEPTIQLISPDHTVFDSDDDYAKVERGNNTTYLYIQNASEGDWSILTSSAVTHTVLGWYGDIQINSFSIEKTQEEEIRVTTQVSHEEDVSFSWILYAVTEDVDTGSQKEYELKTTYGTTNTESVTSVDISELPDGVYYLKMYAIISYPDEVEIEECAVTSDSFQVSGHTQKGNEGEVTTILNPEKATLSVDWSAISAEYETAELTVTTDKGELLYQNRFPREETTFARVNLESENSTNVSIRIRPITRELYSVEYRRNISLDSGVQVSIDTAERTGNLMAKISYDVGKRTLPLLAIVNQQEQGYQITGTGSFSIQLEEAENNDLIVRYDLGSNCFYELSKTITVQSQPPLISLFGITDGVSTRQNKILIPGSTDPYASLQCNGTEVAVDADGSFLAEVTLVPGDNVIEFFAVNDVGIGAKRTINIIRIDETIMSGKSESTSQDGFLPFIISGITLLTAFCILGITGAIAYKRSNSTLHAMTAVIKSLCVFLSLWSGFAAFFCFTQRNSVIELITGRKLVRLLDSFAFASVLQGLDKKRAWTERMTVFMIAAFIFIGGLIILTVLEIMVQKGRARMKKWQENRDTKVSKTEEPKENMVGSGLFCPYCGAKRKVGTRFCGQCGKPFNDNSRI